MGSNDAIKLFLKKEFTELRGRRNFNLWVLTGIFFVSILVIGFGSASMSYLRYKMDDPFINWVDIVLDQEKMDPNAILEKPDQYLNDEEVQKHFQFLDPQPNHVDFRMFWKKDLSMSLQFDGRSIAAYGFDRTGKKVTNPILTKILDPSNVVEKRNISVSDDDDLGVIITAEMAYALGYKEPPSFIALSQAQDPVFIDIVGLTGGTNDFYPVYVPVIAVVKQLPSMMSFLFTNRFWRELHHTDPFSLILDENNKYLQLCGDEKYLTELKKKAEEDGFEAGPIASYLESWDELSCLRITCMEQSMDRTRRFNELMTTLNPDRERCTRVYDFRKPPREEVGRTQFYSIRMESLDSLRAFAEDIHAKCGLKLEMTNVEAKENFNFVQRMGMVLSGSIIVIVALFILVFIYFMLQSHFQKIQRNLGTFKAFGVDNRTLDRIYIRLILRIVGIAFALGAVVAAVVAWIWSLISVIEHGYRWVNVFSWWNLLLLLLAVLAAAAATLLVSNRMLKKTPGDLIYDRA